MFSKIRGLWDTYVVPIFMEELTSPAFNATCGGCVQQFFQAIRTSKLYQNASKLLSWGSKFRHSIGYVHRTHTHHHFHPQKRYVPMCQQGSPHLNLFIAGCYVDQWISWKSHARQVAKVMRALYYMCWQFGRSLKRYPDMCVILFKVVSLF